LACTHNARHNSASICFDDNSTNRACTLHAKDAVADSDLNEFKLAYPLHTCDLDISINDAKCRERGCCEGGYAEHM
jgi:hypothetical protein